MADIVELLSLVLAILIGAPLLLTASSAHIVALVYVLGVIAGALGSRTAAAIRRRQSLAEIRQWAKHYPED